MSDYQICSNCLHPIYPWELTFKHSLPITVTDSCYVKKGATFSTSNVKEQCGCINPEPLGDKKLRDEILNKFGLLVVQK